MCRFFFDTANIEYIKNLWDNHLKNIVNPDDVVGITTNPNAFAKIGKFKFSEWYCHIPKLLKLMDYIKGNHAGEVHIQIPYSNMPLEEITQYINLVKSENDRIYIKIPPRLDILATFPGYYNFNVTGLADTATLIKCLDYNATYLSIIPGRMEEVGIDARSHVKYTMTKSFSQIITGSMRTLEQLEYCIEYNTIPTIGEKVFNMLIETNNLNVLQKEHVVRIIDSNILYPPITTEANINLSKSFFEQMDNLGKKAYQEFTSEYMV